MAANVPHRPYERVHASVRFWGRDLDPFDVTAALLLPPETLHRRGEPRLQRSHKGRIVQADPYSHGMWGFSSEAWVRARSLEPHVRWLLEQLEPKAEAVHALLVMGVLGDIHCFSMGAARSPPALAQTTRDRVARLGLALTFDHYPRSPGDPGWA